MKIKTDTLKGKIAVLALVGEVLIGLGCTWIILSHYYSLTEGATIISSAGVLLTLVFASAGLHFLISGETTLFRGVSCFVWVGLTFLEAALAITIWMGTQHGKDLAANKTEITAKQKQLRETTDRDERRQIKQDITELRQAGNVEAFDQKKQPELHWLYHTGIHSLPFPCGFLGMFLIIVFGVIQSKEEEDAKTAAKSKSSVQQPVPPQDTPARKVGFQSVPVYAKDKEADDPKERGH